MITNLRNSNGPFKTGVEESIFSSALFDEIKGHLSEGLDVEISELRQQLEQIPENEENTQFRMGVQLRILSNEKILVEIYGKEPYALIQEHQQIAFQYKQMKLYEQSYYHYIQAIHTLKIYKEAEKGMDSDKSNLEMELYVQVCKACCKLKSFREAQFYIEEYERIDPSIKLYAEKNEDIEDSPKSAKLYVETNKDEKQKINGIDANLKIAYLKGVIFYKLCQFKLSKTLMQQCQSHLDRLESDEDTSQENNQSLQDNDMTSPTSHKIVPRIKFYTLPEQKRYKLFKLKIFNYLFKIERKLRQYSNAFYNIEQVDLYTKGYRDEFLIEKENAELMSQGKTVDEKLAQNLSEGPGKREDLENFIETGMIFAIEVKFFLRKLVLLNLIKSRPADAESEQTVAWLKDYDKDLVTFLGQFQGSDRTIKVLATKINQFNLIEKVLQFLKSCLSASPVRTQNSWFQHDVDNDLMKRHLNIVSCMERILNILKDQIPKDRLSYLLYLKALINLKVSPDKIEEIKKELINSKKLARETSNHKLYHEAETLLVQIKDNATTVGISYDQIEKAILMVQSH